MKTILRIFGVLLVILGVIWFFQGINVIKGSFMTGQTQWAVYGVIAVIVGIALNVLAARRMKTKREES